MKTKKLIISSLCFAVASLLCACCCKLETNETRSEMKDAALYTFDYIISHPELFEHGRSLEKKYDYIVTSPSMVEDAFIDFRNYVNDIGSWGGGS